MGMYDDFNNMTKPRSGGAPSGMVRIANDARRIWIPKDASKTFLFLDDPYPVQEHGWGRGKERNYATCRGSGCDECNSQEKERRWISTVGFHTVVSLTPFITNSNKQFWGGRDMFAAKWGGAKRPGPLQKLKLLVSDKTRGHLAGCVIKCTRMGEGDTVGDMFEIIEVLTPNVIKNSDDRMTPRMFEEHLKPVVVKWISPWVEKHLRKVNAGAKRGEKCTSEQHFKYNPIELVNWETYLSPENNPRSNILQFLGPRSSDAGRPPQSRQTEQKSSVPF